ncbi:hypothetical protein BASA50_002225 [Batrachochytrium salamandrivorans]|uniref:Uncharacterized protein n=1 Tax=Batrachochytrium salamandrivorans TaxID=1357716 RepID=A0ABQ8FPV6_9FUNG|nr:hypothetical protein BASA50_002225 [Batrachochytrium salamandrivorans]KAH9269473.1 hypothetical protein BASA83_008422 [Batrachochytrium salamandrivorans]
MDENADTPLLQPTGSREKPLCPWSWHSLVPAHIWWLLLPASAISLAEGTIQPLRNLLLGQFTSIFSVYATAQKHAAGMNTTIGYTDTVTDEDTAVFASSLHWLLMYALTLAFSSWLLSFAQSFVFKLIAQKQVQILRTRYMNALLHSSSNWRESNPSQQLVQTISSDINHIEAVFSEKLPWVLRNLVVFLVGLYLAFRSSIQLSLAVLAVFPIVGMVLGFMHHNSAVFDKKLRDSYRSAGQIAHEVLISIKTVMAFNRQSHEYNRYVKHLADACSVHQSKCVFDGFGWGTYSCTMFLAFAVSFYVGGRLVAANSITPGDALNSFSQIAVGITSLGNIGQASRDFQHGVHLLQLLADQIWELETQVDPDSGIEPALFIGKIEFRDVWFRYPSRINRWILQGLNLIIQPGNHVALVGPSGCGKSTMLHLLTGLYRPNSGVVLLDGIDVTTISTKWIRRHMGISSQSSDVFDGSIHDNISLGTHGSVKDTPRSLVELACGISEAATFIGDLPSGYDTVISSVHTSLSGGQIQRLAIARAYIGSMSGMLILDEATSALDSSTEKLVLDSLVEARRSQTTLCVSHRVASLSIFSRIVVFKDGVVAEDGTFEELCKPHTIFRGLLDTHHSDTSSIVSGTTTKGASPDAVAKIGSDLKPVEASMTHVNLEKKLQSAVSPSHTKVDSSQDGPRGLILDLLARATEFTLFFYRVVMETKKELRYLIVGYIGSTLEGLQSPLQGYVIGKVVAGYALPTAAEVTTSTSFWSLMIILIGAGSLVAAVMNAVGFGYAASRNMYTLRGRIFRHVLYQDMTFFNNPTFSPTNLEIVLLDATERIGTVSGNLPADMLRSIVNLAVGVYIGVSSSWAMSILMLAPIPVIFAIGAVQAQLLARFSDEYQKKLENSARFTAEIVTKLHTISLLSKEGHFLTRYCSILNDFTACNTKNQFAVSFGQGMLESMTIFIFSLGLYSGGTLMLWGWATNEQVLVSLLTLSLTAISLGNLSNSISYALGPASVAVRGIFDILDREPRIHTCDLKTTTQPDSANTSSQFTGVHIKNVTFSFDRPDLKQPLDDVAPVLFDIDISIAPGQKVALVGPTGSGKSSILSLVQRLYDPQHGSILFNGVDIQQWDTALLRSRIGIVPQFPDMFDQSVRYNIAYGCPGARMDDIERAARLASAHDFITALPDGYDTRVGEQASLLSGGQRQRLAIARIYLMQPSLIILDEATSALDVKNEVAVIDTLEAFAKDSGKGVLVVTHRLDTIRDANCIHVLNHGRVVASGTHSELMRSSQIYMSLVANSA